MALITLSGYPCSGKSTRASELVAQLSPLLPPQLKLVTVSDESLNISPSVYDDSRSEKPARGALFTAIQRLMAEDTVLIVDAPNYIKGFRYQIYCAAREMKLRVCTVYVVATPDVCRQRNASRTDGRAYTPETLENLMLRFEEPSSMVRWDSPLFTIPWTDQNIPAGDIAQAVTSGSVKPPNSGTLSALKAPSDALHVLEQTSIAMVSAIMDAQVATQGSGGLVTLPLSPSLQVKITLPARNLTLSELQRLKRQFVTVHKKAITLGTTEKGAVDWGEESVANKFVTYLEENMKP
ncbi:chromatin associated protein KTI12 [Roridomyces roridus]|uniref:Chromatin associated protein KTI12 n=1 Tax=Roridomyces roridus TaxID=1738132 RepID=A0AAD7CFE6_9AGAR|nr:chromatin associated protein KTI12 [Roridomyces roridus]